jgi:hypothetical protein
VSLKCGDTFLLPKSSNDTEHLWIVITEPDANGESVCVNITTRRSYSETTVVLQPGNHPFIAHESVIFYADARIIKLKNVEMALNAAVKKFACVSKDPCGADLLRRIQAGMIASKQAKKGVKEYFKKAMGIP